MDTWVSATLLPRAVRGLHSSLEGTKADLKWDAHRLHVGLHMRVFVDYAKRRVAVSRIKPAFWTCVAAHVRALQAARGVAANETLIFVASDLAAARPKAKEALGGLGTVRWNGRGGGFQHTETRRDAAALRSVMTDWLLLSASDAVIGTDLSTFGPTAAVHGGVSLALASMKPGRRERCAAVPRPD